jgi:hypothetical protein
MSRRLRCRSSFAFAALFSLAGCAESIYLSSQPSGASVTVNGQPVGRTPLIYSVRPADWNPPYRYHAEREGYEPVDGTLPTGVSEGRLIGGILTLGLSLFFKQPGTFLEEEHSIELPPESAKGEAPGGVRRPSRPEPRPPAVPYEPPAEPDDTRYERQPPPVPQPTPAVRRPPPPPARPRPTASPARAAPRRSPAAVAPPPPRPAAPPPPRPAAPPPPPPRSESVAPPAPPPAPPPAAAAPSVQEELERLRKLRDDGVIVDAEYEQLRESVLKGQ